LECPLDFGWIDSDPDKLRICLLNLIKNSISLTGSGGKITINTKRSTDDIRIDVTDTSKGLSKIDLSKIFDGFNKLSVFDIPSHSAGIVFANRVLDLLDGRIEIKSKINQGTTMSLILPQGNNLTSVGFKT
jgi:signal transduction histidine kinase